MLNTVHVFLTITRSQLETLFVLANVCRTTFNELIRVLFRILRHSLDALYRLEKNGHVSLQTMIALEKASVPTSYRFPLSKEDI